MCISVKIGSLPEISELESVWRDLESRSRGSFFVTWAWIGVWLANLPRSWPLRLISAKFEGCIVGLGIIVRGDSKKLFNIPYCTTEHLHETGDKELDMVIEHNDFLLDESCEDSARSAMIAHWLGHTDCVSELCIPGTSRDEWLSDAIDLSQHGMLRLDMTMKSHAMDLNEVRQRGGDPLTLIDGKTRAKIRRAKREYESIGSIAIKTASSVMEGLEWFELLGTMHQKRWTAKGEPGCFSNKRFIRFHRMMIARNHANGGARVMRINVGNMALGYLYGFADKERFYLYQCGFDYDMVDKNSMPGLVCHVLAMEALAVSGLQMYDFMAGNSRYKRALSNVEENMTWTIFRRDSIIFRCIDRANPVLVRMRHQKRRLLAAYQTMRTRSRLAAPLGTTVNQGV